MNKFKGLYIIYLMLCTYRTFLPDIMLYKITITAITNKICTKLPVASPGTIPNIPNNHIIIQITATNHNRLLIMCVFLDCLYDKVKGITPLPLTQTN